MDMRQRDEGDVVIFDLLGELRGGPADDATFKRGVQKSIDDGARHILLNLSELRWINSTGLGFIVAVYHAMRDEGGTIKMCQPNERIAHIFATTRFDKVIGIYPSEKEALASF
jgi:anti-sigma B factor antagonist